jgi:prevent-host-death family protein
VFVSDHDPNLKGNVAELKIVAELASLGVPVLRPMTKHERYDLVIDVGGRFLRVQCKSAPLYRDVIVVRTESNRRGPNGFVRKPYTADEVDGIAAYCPELDSCYLLMMDRVTTNRQITLRVSPTKNGQRACLHWASEHELSGAIAQLGEHLRGTQGVAGSSPASSIPPASATLGADEFRQRFGWYVERASVGESFLITRRGKPYARLTRRTSSSSSRRLTASARGSKSSASGSAEPPTIRAMETTGGAAPEPPLRGAARLIMSIMRRFSPATAAAAEQESREWFFVCGQCGTARSVRQLGGIRYKASSRGAKRRMFCPTCGTSRWHDLVRRRPTDPAPAAPAPSRAFPAD